MGRAEGHITQTRYYPDGKVWRTIDAKGNAQVTNTYNADGSLQKVADAKGNITQYEYNGFMGDKKTTYADGTYTEPGYDGKRHLQTFRTRAGHYIYTSYDGLHRLKCKSTRQTLGANPDNTITYKYDLAGRVLRTTDNTGTITNTYDLAGRLTSVSYPNSKTVSYQYDLAGRRTRLTYPDNTYITYEYDQLNRLTAVKNQSGTALATYTYDARSRCTNTSYANGTSIQPQYDAASRLLTITNQTNAEQHKYAYTYDKVGNRLTMLVNDTQLHSYNYDAIYQVTEANYPQGYFASDALFNYDDAGNRSSVIESQTTNYVTDSLNRYTSAGSTYYDYDDNGNLTYDANLVYAYDIENRLTQVTKGAGGNGPLSAAVDSDLPFTTGGDANWVKTTTDFWYGHDSARSGTISDGQTTWVRATVNGPGTISFYVKLSCKNYIFSIDDQVVGVQGATSDWTQNTRTITTFGPHTIEWRYTRGTSWGQNCMWLDRVQWQPNALSNSVDLQRGLDMGWPVVCAGDVGWSMTGYPYYHDHDCAQSGSISVNQVSQMQATVTGAGTVSFWWKVSSKQNYNWLEFYIDDVRQDRISGTVGWQQKTYTLSGSGTHLLRWQYVKTDTDTNDCGWVDWLQGPGTTPPQPDMFALALDCNLSFTTGGDQDWSPWSNTYYHDGDAAQSGAIGASQESWLQTTVTGSGTVWFWWKVSSRQNYHWLEFYIDGVLKDHISGTVDWQQKTYTVTGAGSHTLKWRYVKDGNQASGSDCGWVDWLQWPTQTPPPQSTLPPAQWKTVTYTYDPMGRRIARSVDSWTQKYVYDGSQAIADYDGSGNLLRKYVYAGTDHPICMVNVADGNAVSYYHYDGLGSVVALSNASGNTVQTYKYSVYGRVSVQDANNPNPFMFTGQRYDVETGLYYYKARYYNASIGRFLQTDPIGYGGGMNWHTYCGNNPANRVDPSGMRWVDSDGHIHITISLYDRTEDMRDAFREEADDLLPPGGDRDGYGIFDYCFGFGSPQEILSTLKTLTRGGIYTIDDVYLYGHHGLNHDNSTDRTHQEEGLVLGGGYGTVDEQGNPIWINGPQVTGKALEDFCRGLGGYVSPQGIIQFRECTIAHGEWLASGSTRDFDGPPEQSLGTSFLRTLAVWTGRWCTGASGGVEYAQGRQCGPDYFLWNEWTEYTLPNGTKIRQGNRYFLAEPKGDGTADCWEWCPNPLFLEDGTYKQGY